MTKNERIAQLEERVLLLERVVSKLIDEVRSDYDYSECDPLPEPKKYPTVPEVKESETAKRRRLEKEYEEAAICPHCGTRAGFAFGTGDCGCEVDPE